MVRHDRCRAQTSPFFAPFSAFCSAPWAIRPSLLLIVAIVATIPKTVVSLWERLSQSPFRRNLLLALFSGILMGLTSAPTNWWPLAWIAQAPLWVILYRYSLSKKICEICEICGPAFLWGFGYYGTTLLWITGLHPLTWMGIPWAISLAIALTCWLLITLWGCIWSMTWAVGLTWLTRTFLPQTTLSSGLSRVLAGTALWCGLDTLWSHGILYWPTLAFTQSPHNLWILQLNQLSGPITTTAIIAAVNGLLAEAWIALRSPQPQEHQPQERQPKPVPTVRPYFFMAIALSVIAHTLGALLYIQRSPMSLASPAPHSLTIGLIQGNIPTAVKLTGDGIRQAFNRYTESYEILADQGADMVLMPEGALPVLWRDPDDEGNPVVRAVMNHQIPAIIGTFVPQKSEQDTAWANTITQSLLMATTEPDALSDGRDPAQPQKASRKVKIISQYNKIKLVPLGEYIPADGILGAIITRLSPIQSSMVPGALGQQFVTPFGQAIAGICYESAFPELFRRQTALGGEFMITASNNDPYNGAMMAQHHAQDVMRAIESDRWAVRVTNTGYSGVVNHRGQTVWRSGRNTYETHMDTIHRRHTQTLYVRWGNWLVPLLIGLSVGVMVGIFVQKPQ